MRIKHSEIPQYRSKLLEEQGNQCALCAQAIPSGESVLDHDHRSGYIRGTLHRGCNALLGKIENSLKINKITPDRLEQILKNLEFYTNTHTLYIHPRHGAKKRKKRATK
jgi:hypothetical protein